VKALSGPGAPSSTRKPAADAIAKAGLGRAMIAFIPKAIAP